MSANPPGGDKKGKRMLPSVSDVVRELQGSSAAEPGLLFKAARQVCADELARVKQGFEAAPLDVLVDRARILLDPSLATTPSKDLGGLFDTSSAPPPHVAPPGPPGAGPEDPFAETTGALDLKWEGPAAGAPSATEILPLDTLRGPGEETLAGLERDAQALELKTAAHQPWRGADVPLGTRLPPEPPEEPPQAPYEESRPLFTPPRSSSRSPLLLFVVAVALLGAGFGAWRLFSGKYLDGGKPTPVPYPIARRKRPEPTPDAARRAVSVAPEAGGPASAAPAAPTAVPVPTGTPLAIAAARATKIPLAVPTEAPRATPAPTPTYRLGGGILAAKVPAGGAQTTAAPAPTRAALPPTAAPTRAAAVSTPVPSRPAPTRVAAAAAPKFVPKAQPMPSRDWAGKPGVYVVHFTSYTDRKPATLDAARLQEKYGRPGHAIQVELGAKGTWYRAVLGDFATVEEARAFRARLAEERTPSLGLVYYLMAETQ